MEQVKLGRDIIVGSDFTDFAKYIKKEGYTFWIDGSSVKPTEENIRAFLADYIDRTLLALKDGENRSFKGYSENNFQLTIKCSVKEKSINVKWSRWRGEKPAFEKSFEIVI